MTIKYKNAKKAMILCRPSPFTLEADTEDGIIYIHINNLGDFKELLTPGREISCSMNENSGRSLKYDLIAVKNEEAVWMNLDSNAPNRLVYHWLAETGYENIKPEYEYENSRFDFYAEKAFDRYIYEAKGCYTRRSDAMLFPSGKSKRTLRQLDELMTAAWQGYSCSLVLVIPVSGIDKVEIDPESDRLFGKLFREAAGCGITVYVMTTEAGHDEISMRGIYIMKDIF